MAFEKFQEVTMLSAPGSLGWIYKFTTNRFGEECAIVVWEASSNSSFAAGYRTTIPLRKLTLVVDAQKEA